MKNPDKNIFLPSGCIREDVLFKYFRGSCSVEAARLIEAHLEECALCRDALEGYRIAGDYDSAKRNLERLKSRIQGAVRMRRDLRKKPLHRLYPLVAAAASAVLLMGIASIILMYRSRPETGLADKFPVIEDSVPAQEIPPRRVIVDRNREATREEMPQEEEQPVEKNVEKQAGGKAPGGDNRPSRGVSYVAGVDIVRDSSMTVKAEEAAVEEAENQEIVAAPEPEMTLMSRTKKSEDVSEEVPPVANKIATRPATKKALSKGALAYRPARFVCDTCKGFEAWLERKMLIPDTLQFASDTLVLKILFTVDSTGTVTDVSSPDQGDSLILALSLRAVSESPRWVPASIAGKPMPEQYLINLVFRKGAKHPAALNLSKQK